MASQQKHKSFIKFPKVSNQWIKSGLLFCAGLVVGWISSVSLSNGVVDSFVGGGHMGRMQAWYSRSLLDTGSPKNHVQELTSGRNMTNHVQEVVSLGRSPQSHKDIGELDRQASINKPIYFGDSHKHKDNEEVAKDLFNKVRILCWVMTGGENHRKKADHVMATWGKRCNKIVFMSDTNDDILPVIKFNVGLGRDHLTAKTMHALQYSYKHHMNITDWFLKVDDDSYVILENLRYMLSAQDTTDPVYFGHHFKTIVKQGYFSGGGGYVLSKEAVKRFGTRKPKQCREDGGAEDAELGKCMENLGVRTGDSRDALGRSRFHCFDPETFIHGNYPDWYMAYDKYGAKKGLDALSDYAVTFHYIPVNKMYELEYYVYHFKPYGIVDGGQDLNALPPNITEMNTTTTKSSHYTRYVPIV